MFVPKSYEQKQTKKSNVKMGYYQKQFLNKMTSDYPKEEKVINDSELRGKMSFWKH